MADVDSILVCDKCLHPVGGLLLCPDCHGDVNLMPSLLLQTLRILRAKGWVVEKWNRFDENEWERMRFKLDFFMFAPPITGSRHAMSILEMSGICVELKGLKPSILSLSKSQDEAAKALYLWAVRVPCFALPFGQDLCDACQQQGGDWFFSRCGCPSRKQADSQWVNFSDGIPAKCIYADAQVVTKEVRLGQLDEFFRKNPIARRKVRKEFAVTA